MRGRRLILAPLVALLALGATAAATAEAKRVAKGSGTSFANLSGNVRHPNKLVAEVQSSPFPNEEIDVSWGVSCTGSDFRFQFRQGTYATVTPDTRRLPIPLRRPGKCTVALSASQSDFTVDAFNIAIEVRAK